jgi:hypothetical protein
MILNSVLWERKKSKDIYSTRDYGCKIIKRSIKHHPLNSHTHDFLQATSLSVEDSTGPLTVSAVYLPPKHTVKQVQLAAFYNTLGCWFIAGGDYNAKHTDWGSRLITPLGREVLKTMEQLHLHHLSTGEPTYWPSDRNKLPNLLDFCVLKGIPHDSALTRSCFNLSSDHNYPQPMCATSSTSTNLMQ